MQLSDTNQQMNATFLSEYLVYAINRTIFFMYEWLSVRIPKSYAIKRFMPSTNKLMWSNYRPANKIFAACKLPQCCLLCVAVGNFSYNMHNIF